MNPHLQRARLLLSQSRHELAEKELRQALSHDPDLAEAHAYLAFCLCEREQFREATEEAQQAIHLAPENPYPYYVHAMILFRRNRFDEAVKVLDSALELAPFDPDFFALLAQIRFAQRKWSDTLEAAEQGLQLDADHDGCVNLRAMALVKLGRKDTAGAALDSALARDPENAYTHANQGWRLLEQGQHAKALEHFRESLRIEPNLEWARQGIVEALKARYFIYRIMLSYFLWMMKLSGGAQWGVIIGGYLGYRVLQNIARGNPGLSPWISPLLILYVVFAVMTWVASPLFNLLLRLNRFGRLALRREQIITSNWVGLCVAGAIVSLIGHFTIVPGWGLLSAFVCGLVIPSLAAIYVCDRGWPRTAMVGIALGLIALGVTSLLLFLGGEFVGDERRAAACGELAGKLFQLFVIGALLSQFAVTGLASATVKK